MWKISKDGNVAENKATGKICKIELGRDKLYRVKRGYKTIGTFTEMADAAEYIRSKVKELGGDV